MVIRIISSVLAMIITEIILAQVMPKLKRKEREQNVVAKDSKKVYLDKFLYRIYFAWFIIVYVIGIVLICFPVLCQIMGFDYTTTLIVWWIPCILCSALFIFINKEVVYDENGFTVRNAFGIRKTYLYSEIISFHKNRNMKIRTKKGNVLLANALYGTDAFYTFLREKLKDSI